MYYKTEDFEMRDLSKGFIEKYKKKLPLTSQVLVDVRILMKNGELSDTVQMLLDTGAVISTLPLEFLKMVRFTGTIDYELYEAVKRKECAIKAKVADVSMVIEDENERSGIINTFVAFAHDVPLGMMILREFDVDFRKGYVELRER